MAHLESYVLPCFDTSCPPEAEDKIKSAIDLIEFNAEFNARRAFCIQLKKDSASRLVQQEEITFLNFRDMIYSCQAWMLDHVYMTTAQDQTGKPQPIALLMDSDVTLLVHMFALMGLGIPVSTLFNF